MSELCIFNTLTLKKESFQHLAQTIEKISKSFGILEGYIKKDEVKSYNADIQANNRGVDEEFRKSEVALHIQTEYEEGVYVPGLGARMIVYNLVRNSMEEGATRIDLTVRRQEDQEKSVQVAYRDYTTKPMNEAIARAYERGEASHGQGSHLGLGNKIVRKVLEASRAELQIRPEQDGTTFIFTFGA